MTKIAIYGDSFAADFDGWPKVLESIFNKHYENSRIVTYGLGGSSIDYSYAKFLQTNSNYDIIIFLWTCETRSSLISLENIKNFRFKFHSTILPQISKKHTLEHSSQFPITYPNIFEKCDDLISKWVVVNHDILIKYPRKNVLKHLAIRDSVKLRRPDVISIELFDTTINPSKSGMSKIVISEVNNITSPKNFNAIFEHPDFLSRKNHLSDVQNTEVAKYMFKHINGELDIHDTFENPCKYYTISKTIEEFGITFV